MLNRTRTPLLTKFWTLDVTLVWLAQQQEVSSFLFVSCLGGLSAVCVLFWVLSPSDNIIDKHFVARTNLSVIYIEYLTISRSSGYAHMSLWALITSIRRKFYLCFFSERRLQFFLQVGMSPEKLNLYSFHRLKKFNI